MACTTKGTPAQPLVGRFFREERRPLRSTPGRSRWRPCPGAHCDHHRLFLQVSWARALIPTCAGPSRLFQWAQLTSKGRDLLLCAQVLCSGRESMHWYVSGPRCRQVISLGASLHKPLFIRSLPTDEQGADFRPVPRMFCWDSPGSAVHLCWLPPFLNISLHSLLAFSTQPR